MGSIPLRSTRWTLHEHLFFQRRLRRQGVAVMSKQSQRVKVQCALALWLSIFLFACAGWDSEPNFSRWAAAGNMDIRTSSLFPVCWGLCPFLNTEFQLFL